MGEIHRQDEEVSNTPQKQALSKLRQTILDEVRTLIGIDQIESKVKKLDIDQIIDNYIAYLKKIWDPRSEYISEISKDILPTDIVDNELAHFTGLSERFQKLIQSKKNWENVDHLFDHLDFWTVDALISAVNKYDEKEAIVFLSQFPRPVLDTILITAVGVNVVMMIGHNLESTRELAELVYSFLNIGNLSGKSVVSLWVIAPFLYEAILKIHSQWIKNYLVNNKLDAALNIAGIWEIWVMVEEALWVINNHTALASLLRSLRILRIFRVTQKSQIFKEMTQSVGESLPSMMKIAFTFWGFSILTTLFFMEIYSKHMPEFSSLSNSFDEMTRLFFNDNAIDLTLKMRQVKEVHPLVSETAVWWARTYQFISSIFMIGIPPAIVYDMLAKNNTTKRYLAAIWEKHQEIWNLLKQRQITPSQKKKKKTD